MKKQIKETSISGKRGPQRVITYGYNTQVNGLDVVRIVHSDDEKFAPIHVKSRLSIGIQFTDYVKAVKFVNKYLKGFDFTQDADDLIKDGKLGKCVYNAKIKEGL